jgi:DNA-directed RNA polymerase subunit H (RpoH/RPB5)
MSLKTNEELRDSIIGNVFRMLHYRGWINDDRLNQLLKNKMYSEINEIETTLESKMKIVITFSNQRLNTTKSNMLNQFLNSPKYEKMHKIVVFKDYPDKLKNQLEEKYSNIEIFDEDFFKVDIGSHVIVPKHTKLSKDQATEVIKSYGKESQFPILMNTDPMSRYLYAKQNDMIEIIRPNRNSGFEVYYRIVK